MGIKRIVDTAFWTDSKVDEFSPEDKYFLLYLLTCPFTKQLGIYEISIKQVAFHLGYSIDAVKALIERFENTYNMIIFSPETNEIAVKNYLRHSIVKGGAPVRDCLIKEIKQVKNKQLISDVFAYIKDFDNLNATVKQLIADYEENGSNLDFCNQKEKEIKKEKNKENDNDNENDNEVSFKNRERIVDDSSEYENIKREIIKNKGTGNKICDWCGSKTTVLHKHHHPIPKRMGGTEIVNICSNCHNEFHKLEGSLYGDRHSDITNPPKNPIQRIYGKFNNVFLTDEELQKLKNDYSDYEEKIEKLSAYMHSKKKTYDDHYATIELWALDDKKKNQSQQSCSNPFLALAIEKGIT